jgi:hypothetical protein
MSIALYSLETKYMETIMDHYDSICLCKFLIGLFDQELDPTRIY